MRGYALGGAIAVFAERLRKPPHPNPLPHLHGGEGALQLRLRANQELASTEMDDFPLRNLLELKVDISSLNLMWMRGI